MTQFLLMLHLLGFGIGVGTSMFMTALGTRAKAMPQGQGPLVMGQAGAVAAYLSASAIVLLWASGIAMLALTPGLAVAGGAWFHAKLLLAVVLTVLIGLIHRSNAQIRRGENADAVRKRLRPLVIAVLAVAVTNMVLAVIAFE